jgi:serine/threonine-protein kinase
VVAVFDQGSDGPFLYLAMEYVPGRTLKELLTERGRFAPAAALDIMAGVLDGLAAAHASGIVHRDVKPENVLLAPDGRLKVADFGLARAQAAAAHTRAGLLIGTVAYLPPEQVTGESMGPRSDVYSAGVVLFELLTGRQPFTGDSPIAVAYQHVNQDVPAPSTLVPGIPVAVDRLVLAATSRDPAMRPADAGEFARAVRRVREGIGEPSGLTGVMGVGVQGLSEAPWLNLDTPAATNGWWARGTGAMPAASPSGTGEWRGPADTAPPSNGPGTGPSSTGPYGNGPSGNGPPSGIWPSGYPGQEDPSSRTLVVHREESGRYRGTRGVGLGLGGWWLASGRYASVPVVANDSVTQATAVLTADGFTIAKVSSVRSNEIPKGTVIGTRPSGRVAKGSAITIVVSAGPFTSVVPGVSGDKLAAAQAALQRVHLTYRVDRVGSDAAVGTVLGTKPAAGTSWPQTKPVTIMVAEGLPVPDFVGQNVQAAEQWASAHGANLQQQQVQNSQQAQGTITNQEPAPGALYQRGETVVVNVSAGPPEVNVPDVAGLSVQQATQELEQAGFQVQANTFGLFGSRVFDYSPVGQAPRGSTITLDVGL